MIVLMSLIVIVLNWIGFVINKKHTCDSFDVNDCANFVVIDCDSIDVSDCESRFVILLMSVIGIVLTSSIVIMGKMVERWCIKKHTSDMVRDSCYNTPKT